MFISLLYILISFIPLISIISFVMIIINKRKKKKLENEEMMIKNEEGDIILKKYFKSYVSNIADLKVEWLNYEKTKINIVARDTHRTDMITIVTIENYLFAIGNVFQKVLLNKQIQSIEIITISIKKTYVDDFGNPVIQDAMRLKLNMENVKKINWSGFSALGLPKLAEEFYVHPSILKNKNY